MYADFFLNFFCRYFGKYLVYARISQDRSFRRFIECTGGEGGRPGEDRFEIGDNEGGNGVKRRGEIYY